MLYLLDSDAARKLAQYDLINELVASLNCLKTDLAILPQLKFQLGLTLGDPSKALAKLGSAEALAAANDLISHASEVEVNSDAANPILELNRPDLDSGEKVLLAALASQPDDKLISGDKRALVAISKIGNVPSLKGILLRILCLEEALYIILETHHFDDISSKVRARPDVDTAISIVFGRSAKSSYDATIQGIASFLDNLQKDTDKNYRPLCLQNGLE